MPIPCLQISLLRNLILYLMVFYINKKMLQWVLPWVKIYQMLFVFYMKENGLKNVLLNSSQSLIKIGWLYFYFSQINRSSPKNFVATLIIFTLICPFHFVFIFDGVYTHSKSFLPSIHNFGMTRQFDKWPSFPIWQ